MVCSVFLYDFFFRRCDGQGHILSGIAAAFLFWSISTSKSPHIIETQENFSKYINATDNRKLNSIVAFDDGMVSNDAIVRAGWAACHLTRSSAYKVILFFSHFQLTFQIIFFGKMLHRTLFQTLLFNCQLQLQCMFQPN